MSGCNVTPIHAKACSGKCKDVCSPSTRVWVVAACEGMISLFEKTRQGDLVPLAQRDQAVFASLQEFQNAMEAAERTHAFDQLIIIGGSADIGWVHASLPQSATRAIVAEINYPLLAAWFKQSLPMPTLTHMLEAIFAA